MVLALILDRKLKLKLNTANAENQRLPFVNPHDKQWFWGGMEADRFNDVIGQIHMQDGKKSTLGVYTRWEKDSGESEARVLNQPDDKEITELEYYDLSADPNEITNTSNSSAAQRALSMLFGGSTHGLLYSELQAELPEKYKEAQARAYHALLTYERLVNASTEQTDAELAQRIEEESERRVKAAWAL